MTNNPELWRQSNIMAESARKPRKFDSNQTNSRSTLVRPRIAEAPRLLTEARRDMLRIAKDHSPAAMLKICEMGGLVDGVEPATNEAVRFACCVEVINRAHGRPHISLTDMSQPLVVDFKWADDAPRLLEAAAIEHDDSETP